MSRTATCAEAPTLADAAVLAEIHSLARIDALPSRFEGPLFRHYPGMKLGCMDDVAAIGARLADRAAGVIAEQGPQAAWALTAPPYYRLPSAANLLAERVHADLRRRGLALPLVDLRLSAEQVATRTLAQFRQTYAYASSSQAAREAERQRLARTMTPGCMAPLSGCHVLVINDIHVTGTQQRYLQQGFDAAGVRASHWLYVFEVERDLAREHPQVEHHINTAALDDAESFAALLNDVGTRCTSRCLSRLFSEEFDAFRHIAARLTPWARRRIGRLAAQEGRYPFALFAERLELLAQCQDREVRNRA